MIRRTSHGVAALLGAGVLASAAGCAAADRGAVRSEVADSAGIQIVRSSGTPQPLVLEPDLVIGTVDGPEELQFYGVLAVAPQPDGTIFVSDRSGTIREFSPAGDFVRSTGRQGEGPGEFLWPSGLHLYGDTIAVVDGQASRITELSRAGGVLATMPFDNRGGVHPVARVDGTWLVLRQDTDWLYEPGRARRDTIQFVRSSAAELRGDSGTDAALRPLVQYETQRRFGIRYGSDGMTVGSPLWEPQPYHAIDGSGNIYITPGFPYRITVHDADGVHWRTIVRDHDPVAASGAMTDEYWNRVNAFIDTAAWVSAHDREVSAPALEGRASLPVNEHLPALGSLIVSADGMLWAQRPDLAPDPVLIEWTRQGTRQDSFWDVFDHEGRFMTTIRFPATFRPRAASGRFIYGVLRDSLDVEHIARYMLPSAV